MDENFNFENMTEEDEEAELDAFVNYLGELIERDERRTRILNVERIHQFLTAFKILKRITKGSDIVLSHKLNEPYPSMGSISIEGRTIDFDDAEQFAVAAELASNTEVYPLTKNAVRMTFTFHGITKPIDSEEV